MGNCFEKKITPIKQDIVQSPPYKEKNYYQFNYDKLYCLIVEDNLITQLLISKYLKEIGFEVIVRDNIDSSMYIIYSWLKHSKYIKRKLLILMDNYLGVGMTGIELCGVVSKNENLTILGMSSNELEKQFILCGSKGFIQKPFNKKKLEEYINKYFI